MPRESHERNGIELDRRSVLRAVGAGAAATAAAGVAAGERRAGLPPRLRVLEADYEDAAAVEAAVRHHAGDVLSALADRDVLDQGTVEELDVGEPLAPRAFAAADGGTHVTAVDDGGVPTAHLVVGVETTAHEVTLVVQPERDHAFAVVESRADGERSALYPGEDGLVEPSQEACWYETDCTSECCDGNCTMPTEYEYHCCDYGGPVTCDPVGPTGDCCDCC